MGMFMGVDDMYIEGLLEVLNLRFGTFPDVDDTDADQLDGTETGMRLHASGIREVQSIQSEFQVFRTDRSLVQSLRALGVGGQWNGVVKRKWFKLLNRLDQVGSEDPQLTGGKAIVAALIAHLRDLDPAPVHFKAHDAREPGANRVLIIKGDRPVFYIDRDFLTVSIPMKPRPKQAEDGRAPDAAAPADPAVPAPAPPGP